MTKSELFNVFENLEVGQGIVIVLNNNCNYLMISKRSILSKEGFAILCYYDENLKYLHCSDKFTINEIWKVALGQGIDKVINLDVNRKTLIYKRSPEVTELTLEDIAKKFEIPVTSLRIKK